jgi:hypothetical protein
MSILDKYNNEKPRNAQANLKGGDKTLIEGDGGLDLSVDEKAIKKARGFELGAGPSGYKGNGTTPSKKYSEITPRE